MDNTLLNSRARKWEEMGRPWFSGLASRREHKDFRRNAALSALAEEYLSASSRARWSISSTIGLLCLSVLLFVYVAKQWQGGLSTELALLKLSSYVMSIHLEPSKEQMVTVSEGSFRMVGRDDQDVRDVKFQKAFKLAKHEVTFDEYDRFALATGRKPPRDEGWGRGRRPVINVSFKDAADYPEWLSKTSGKVYRLPSEAEWEYAARSRGKDEIRADSSNEKDLGKYAWFAANSEGKTHEVGLKERNELGLHDMSGNVWEWVQDCWHNNYKGAPSDGGAWLDKNGGQCGGRVFRGGSWGDRPEFLRSSFRVGETAGYRLFNLGFRLAQDLE